MSDYKPVIGLEIHVELKTKSKMFCQCSAEYFGAKPNSHVCPVCLGMPGALPVPNEKAVEWSILIAHALNCTINKKTKFDRKHYFYPDLPKGYQISQYDEPMGINGWLEIKTKTGEKKKFNIRRVHLEEDTGKLLHKNSDTLIDFNRSSVPLVEIVTQPDFDDAEDVKMFLEELHDVIRYLNVSDADMEKGSMRLEPNISVRKIQNPKPETRNSKHTFVLPNYKVEVKNINSFRFVKLAIEYEVKRQTELLEEGVTPKQETRGFNDSKNVTYAQRSKEEAQDYRYFPEPDIPPMYFKDSFLETIFAQTPELPYEKIARYEKDLKLRYTDAFIITREASTAAFFEAVVKEMPKTDDMPQRVANLIINKKISTTIPPKEFIKQMGYMMAPKTTDTVLLTETIKKVITTNEKVVNDFKSGKQNALMFLIGQVMKEMRGKADATLVRSELEKHLK